MRRLLTTVGVFMALAGAATSQEPRQGSAKASLPDNTRQSFRAESPAAENDVRTARIELDAGNLFFRESNYPRAIESFNRALALDPSFFQAHYNLGVAYVDARQFREALAAFKEALVLRPGFPAVLKYLGSLHQKLGEFEMATQYFSDWLVIDPKAAEAHNGLGAAWARLG